MNLNEPDYYMFSKDKISSPEESAKFYRFLSVVFLVLFVISSDWYFGVLLIFSLVAFKMMVTQITDKK